MKKFLLSTCAVVIVITTFAQQARLMSTEAHFDESKHTTRNLAPIQPHSSSAAIPVWTNDFSNSGDWVVDNSANVPLTTGNWWICNDPNLPSWPVAALAPFNSTSAANGFAYINSDSAGQTATQDCYISLVTPIDLSLYNAVNIEFEHSYRVYYDTRTVEVSNDGGNTWIEYIVTDGTTANINSGNVDIASLNISATAANQSSVLIRFHYIGAWGWYWAIDNVAIVETPNNLLSFGSETFGGWWIGYQSTNDIGTDFTFYPMNQANAQPYRFEGVLYNGGLNTLNNSVLHVNVMDEAGGSQDFTSNIVSVPGGANDTVATTTNFSPSQYGFHNFSYWATSDSFPTTDTIGRSAVVTDTVYAVDYDWGSDGANAEGGYYLGKSCGGQVLGNVFDIYAATTVTSISFHVNASSVPGSVVKVELYESDFPAFDPIPLEGSNDYTLLSTDTNSWVTLKLLNPYLISAGTAYLAAVKGYQHPLDTTLISSSSNDNTSSLLQDNCDASDPTSQHIAGMWYGISSPLLIRINTTGGGINSINDIDQKSLFNVYPNPTNGVFTIELDNNVKYDVTVNNVLGQTVYTTSTTSMNTIIDLSNFEKGIYIIELKNNTSAYTEKVIIE